MARANKKLIPENHINTKDVLTNDILLRNLMLKTLAKYKRGLTVVAIANIISRDFNIEIPPANSLVYLLNAMTEVACVGKGKYILTESTLKSRAFYCGENGACPPSRSGSIQPLLSR